MNGQSEPQGWLDTLKQTFSLEELGKRFDLSLNNILEMSAYLGIGFISGFLVKKYGRYVVCAVLIAGLSIWGLEHLNIITIDWARAKDVIGVSDTQTVQSLWGIYIAWVKEHIFAAAGVVIGFLVGYRVG